MDREEALLRKRLIELSQMAFHKGIVIFSDFLNLNELHILHTTPKDLFYTEYETFGGYEMSERQIAAFLPDALCCASGYPITPLEILPTASKFAVGMSHRDYLGALVHLGIERSKIGDILVYEKSAVVFVKREMAAFITEQLTRIGRQSVRVKEQEEPEETYLPSCQLLTGTVASVRLDTVLAVAYPLSRSKIVPLIEGGRTFVNGKMILSNGFHLKEGDVISVRQLGRIVYEGELSVTRKGRHLIQVKKFG